MNNLGSKPVQADQFRRLGNGVDQLPITTRSEAPRPKVSGA